MIKNLFIRHHRLLAGDDEDCVGSGWENEFTEALAFYLSCDTEACERLCRELLGPDYEAPSEISTQLSSKEGTPDLAIQLASGRRLFIENKIDSPLGSRQLERYLQIRDDAGRTGFLAFFAKKPNNISREVLGSSCYKHPSRRDHYLWRDLYALIPSPNEQQLGISVLRMAWREYLGMLGFAPAKLTGRWDLLLEDSQVPENREVHIEFGRQLEEVRSYLRKRGFKVTDVAYKGLQARPIESEPYIFLTINPARAASNFLKPEHIQYIDGSVLSVGVVYEGRKPPNHAKRLAIEFPTPFTDAQGRQWCATFPVQFSNGKRTKVRFMSSLNWFLEKDDEIATRVGSSCASVVDKIIEVASGLTDNH